MGEFASKATGGTALGLSIGALGVEALNGGIGRLLGNIGGAPVAQTAAVDWGMEYADIGAAVGMDRSGVSKRLREKIVPRIILVMQESDRIAM